jgi:hypothetical protein
MLSLKKRGQRKILYNALVDSLGEQIGDRWERKMFQRMVRNTRIRSVDEISSRPGWKVEGQNVNHVVVGPRGSTYVGPVDIYVPKTTLERLRKLSAKSKAEREVAEQALHTVAHEFAHDYFKSINYEARMTRYFREKPHEVEAQLSSFLEKGGRFRGIEASEKAKKLVRDNPLFWSNYLAHTAHEAGADAMAAESVARIAEGRHATPKDLERLTAFRPFTVREYLKVKMGGRVRAEKPRQPGRLERLSRGIEYSSMELLNKVGRIETAIHPAKAREHMARLREARGMRKQAPRRHR